MGEFRYWNGTTTAGMSLLGEWDGTAVRPLKMLGEWTGSQYAGDPTVPATLTQPTIVGRVSGITSSTARVDWSVSEAGTEAVTGWDNGRDGTDAGGSGAYSVVDPASATGRTFLNLRPDTLYGVYVQAKTASGVSNRIATTFRTSVVETSTGGGGTTTPTDGSRRIALVGASGLGFNATVFSGGYDVAPSNAFATWRNRPIDGHLYFAARQSWSDFRGAIQSQQKALLDAGKLVILSLPPAPESFGSGMWGQVLNGQHDADWRSFGAYLVGQGWNVPNFVIRLGWEGNGNWYAWSYQNAPGSNSAEKAANVAAGYRKVISAIRAGGATNVRFNQCWNKAPSQSGFDMAAFPGADYVDIVGIDQYDRYGVIIDRAGNTSNGTNEYNRTPSVKTVAEFARSKGILWSIDEWGVWHGDSEDPNGGGDNPLYPQFIWDAVQANRDILAWENTYDDNGAPSTARHKLSDGQNPKAAASYRALWGR